MRKLVLSVLLVLGGAAVFVFGSPYYTVLSTNGNQSDTLALAAFFLIGRRVATVITALAFGASHVNAIYGFPGGGVVFGPVVLGLGLVGAHATFKENGLIGPVLLHAG